MKEERKYYSFLTLNKCISDKGNTYTGVTAELTLSRIEFKNANGKMLCVARAAINNRNKMLNSALGSNFPLDEEAVWVDVNIWEDRAERFKKFIGDRTKIRLVVTGNIALHKYSKGDGTPGESVSITVQDWLALPSGNSKNTDETTRTETTHNETAYNEAAAYDDLPY